MYLQEGEATDIDGWENEISLVGIIQERDSKKNGHHPINSRKEYRYADISTVV